MYCFVHKTSTAPFAEDGIEKVHRNSAGDSSRCSRKLLIHVVPPEMRPFCPPGPCWNTSPSTVLARSRCIPISRRLFNHRTANRFGDDFSIAIFAGEASRPVKIVRTENFHVPGVRFQFGRDVDFPKPRAVTDSRKNSRCHGLLKPLWDFISYNL